MFQKKFLKKWVRCCHIYLFVCRRLHVTVFDLRAFLQCGFSRYVNAIETQNYPTRAKRAGKGPQINSTRT